MAPRAPVEPPERIEGEITYVVYADTATGFGVVSLDERREGSVKASGPLANLTTGDEVTLMGRWVDHARHGRTFEADFYELATPSTPAGLRAFLASERFPGVGDTIATRLVATFGTDLGQVITEHPDRLTGVTGVSAAMAQRISAGWLAAGMLPTLVQRLAEVDLSPGVARAVLRRFGEDALDVLEQDPYALLSVPGVRWTHADRLGRRAGIAEDDPRRLAAGAAGFLRGMCGRDGHTYAALDVLLERLPAAIGGGRERAVQAVEEAVAVGEIRREDHPLGGLPCPRVAPPPLYDAELAIAEQVRALLGADGGTGPLGVAAREAGASDGAPAGAADGLTAEQAAAVAIALTSGVSILTGGPGTGKTHAVTDLVRRAVAAGANVALCAPTGRAAKRLEEVTGHAATTVHRLLEARPEAGEGFVFGRTAENPLPHDLVVADEWSMADVHLAAALLEALAPPTHLLLVGDPDQLPPVGPGGVLRDLLDSGAVPVTRLTTVHRQAAESRIVTLAHELNRGDRPVVVGRDGDVFAVPEQGEAIPERVASIVAERAPAFFGCSPADVQVLASMYRGPAGVDALNAALKERLNPAGGRRAVAGWHEGDRVVATRNDPEADVANGDIGEVAATDVKEGSIRVAFPQGEVELQGDRLQQLAPAWCLTVHKSQGGEWPVVVLVLDRSHRTMLTRELVYTAITRARRGLLLVGQPDLLAVAAGRVGGGAAVRDTTLAARLGVGETSTGGQ